MASITDRVRRDMATSTPGLAHAIATRHPGRLHPTREAYPAAHPGRRHRAGSSVAAGLLARGSTPITWPSRGPVASGGGRLAAYSCGGSHGFGQARTVFPSPPRPKDYAAPARNASALRARVQIAPNANGSGPIEVT